MASQAGPLRTWRVGAFLAREPQAATNGTGADVARPAASPSPSPSPPAVLIILNQPICGVGFLDSIWRSTSRHVCADGGANCLFDGLEAGDRIRFLPDEIRGDLDSLRDDVRIFYESLGVPVVKESDQDSTDFGKCLRQLTARRRDALSSHNGGVGGCDPDAGWWTDLIVLGGLGGRFDQTMASINTLYQLDPDISAYLVSNESIAVLLRTGYQHVITCDTLVEGPTCGLIPVGVETALVRTSGLRWEIDHSMPLSFGGLVSTSNAFAPDEENSRFKVVQVETSAPVIWTQWLTPDPAGGAGASSGGSGKSHTSTASLVGSLPPRRPSLLALDHAAVERGTVFERRAHPDAFTGPPSPDDQIAPWCPARTVLVPVDSSRFSEHALNWAVQNLVRPESDLVVLLHVRSDHALLAMPAGMASDSRDDAVGAHKPDGLLFNVRGVSVKGDPRVEILKQATDLDADIVVVGCRGLGPLQSALLGSVSAHLVRNSSVPVVVVRASEDDEVKA
ncbi:hypothetical protein HK405_008174 [Cladochytrium tenue]|nr:hypothetical protein HK405_008174 [Cladochytrium tenue]